MKNLLRARPKVGGERRRKQIPRPAAHPSTAASGPGPKTAVRDAEKQVPGITARPSATASGRREGHSI